MKFSLRRFGSHKKGHKGHKKGSKKGRKGHKMSLKKFFSMGSRKRLGSRRLGSRRLRSRRFGSAEYGPGFLGQTSFENAVAAPYFGSQENFVNPSEWFLPVADNQYQSPQMLQNWK